MKKLLFLLIISCFFGCKSEKDSEKIEAGNTAYNEASEIEKQQAHENERMRFKLIQSKVDRGDMWKPFQKDLQNFGEEAYNTLKPQIIEKDILAIQQQIKEGKLTYKELVLFYLYRIHKYESNPNISLYSIISLNKNVVEEAEEKDRLFQQNKNIPNQIFGMPILLKDNIGTIGMPTTAGAVALLENYTDDAFITKRLKEKGALILGKANLSEWAYYFCDGCPLGYSAIGGQTLNPYGRKIFESGGSSSGSGAVTAVNYAVAAVGTETAGSILSPSSQNSVVGLKPTVGLLSRSGIVPISSTLDTPGPMTKNVTDNAILLDAMLGKDQLDVASVEMDVNFFKELKNISADTIKLGALKSLMEGDTIYLKTIQKLKEIGFQIVEIEAPNVELNGFLTLLNIDMKNDLPAYLDAYASKEVTVKNIQEIIDFNLKDSVIREPYKQALFDGIVSDTTTIEQLEVVKDSLQFNGRQFFEPTFSKYKVDAVLSINNYHAAYAAVAKYPALAMPMGYKKSGEPISLTFIALPFQEQLLLQLGYIFEQELPVRKLPQNYE
ncbi:amidase family protein [Galbibacter mesophilus]|uniref:amidase family protein n=1 Tax=Galbibacter mesophilus TaxID=379069 RepID=UPI0019202E7A|nr:amidase family protein [Galbibacter mesophilus]MCM5663720.1 amidase family protein [Galbibacter mesophilus]